MWSLSPRRSVIAATLVGLVVLVVGAALLTIVAHACQRPVQPPADPLGPALDIQVDRTTKLTGTAQILAIDETDDTVLIDAFVNVDPTSGFVPLTDGPTTFAVHTPTSSFLDTAIRSHMRKWSEGATIVDLEVQQAGSALSVDIHDGRSKMRIDVTPAV